MGNTFSECCNPGDKNNKHTHNDNLAQARNNTKEEGFDVVRSQLQKDDNTLNGTKQSNVIDILSNNDTKEIRSNDDINNMSESSLLVLSKDTTSYKDILTSTSIGGAGVKDIAQYLKKKGDNSQLIITEEAKSKIDYIVNSSENKSKLIEYEKNPKKVSEEKKDKGKLDKSAIKENKALNIIEIFNNKYVGIKAVYSLLCGPIQTHHEFQKVCSELQDDLSTLPEEKLQTLEEKIERSLKIFEKDNEWDCDPDSPSLDTSLSGFAHEQKSEIDQQKKAITDEVALLDKFNSNINFAMNEINNRYTRIVKEFLPVLKDSENENLNKLRDNLHKAKEKVNDAQRFKFRQEGLKKRQEIHDTRYISVNEYNNSCKDEYHKRYETSIVKTQSGDFGQLNIRARVRGAEAACYYIQLKFEQEAGVIKRGEIIECSVFKSRPNYDSFSLEKYPYGEGGFDNEVEYNGTKPLKYNVILFNMKNKGLEYLKKDYDITKLKINEYSSEHIINPKSKHIIDLFIDRDNEEKIWEKDTPGYNAWAKAPMGASKFYLAEHHYTNVEIKSVVLERVYNGEEGADGSPYRYYALHYFGNKIAEVQDEIDTPVTSNPSELAPPKNIKKVNTLLSVEDVKVDISTKTENIGENDSMIISSSVDNSTHISNTDEDSDAPSCDSELENLVF